jgi:biotin transport system substrate-specific component
MSQAIASRPLVSLALPDSGAARLLVQGLIVVAGTLVLTLSAKTKVVLGPVDLSLQTLAILMIAASLGMRMAMATLLLYLAQGAMGFPVFQSTPEKGIGLAYMAGPTGGYLLGFLVMAAIVGYAADRGWDRNVGKLLGAMLVGEVAMMALGFAWLAVLIGAANAWTFGVLPFVLPDLIKVGLAACLVPAGWAALRGLGVGRS